MKNIIFAIIICLFLFASGKSYAGTNSLVVNYPAVSGSYNRISLQTSLTTSAPDCSQSNNQGMIFLNPNDNNNMDICVNNQAVPYNETCFNRFCAGNGCNPNGASVSNPCPTGFSPETSGGSTLVQTFNPEPGITVSYFVCCNTGSVVLPTS